MINKQDFKDMRDRMEVYDQQREALIKKSREIVKLSKRIIYSIHRDEMDKAKQLIKDIKAMLSDLNKIAKDNPRLIYTGSFKVAIQEYVEAIAYYEFVENKKIPTHKELKVGSEYYLLGLTDLTGELVRKAINDGIKGDFDSVLAIKELVAELYGEFLKFDLANSELRKKFDGMKYDLNKLENLVFDLKVKSKI